MTQQENGTVKKARHKDLIWFVSAVVLVAFFYGVWFYGEILFFNWALAKYDWENHDGGEVSQLKLRIICHKVISYQHGNHHDAFIALDQVGNSDSIPFLINSLKWHEPPAGIDIVDCTADHCVDCLQKLTGMDFGYSHKEWSEWWQKHGTGLSPEELAGRAAKAAKATGAKTTKQ